MTDLTIREAAALLRVSEPTLRRWIALGRVPATRIGRTLRIKQSDLARLARDVAPNGGPAHDVARAGSGAALLEASERCSAVALPEAVDELEQLIAEGCERPGEVGETVA